MTWAEYFNTVEWIVLIASIVGAYGSGSGTWNTLRDYWYIRVNKLNGRKSIISYKNLRINICLFTLQVMEAFIGGVFVSQPLTPSQQAPVLQAILSYSYFAFQACVLAWLTIINHRDYMGIVHRFEPDMRPPINP